MTPPLILAADRIVAGAFAVMPQIRVGLMVGRELRIDPLRYWTHIQRHGL